MIELLSGVARDIRYAMRLFGRHRVTATTAIVALGLTLGTSAGIIAVLNAWLFPPVGVDEPRTLQWMTIAQGPEDGFTGALTYRDFEAVRERSDIPVAAFLSGVTAVRTSEGLEREEIAVGFVTSDFFSVAGAAASMGRLFDTSEEQAGSNYVVLSDDAWTRMYGRSPAVLGQSIEIGGRQFVIVGVAASRFTGPLTLSSPAVWLPVGAFGEGDRQVLQAANPRVLVRLRDTRETSRFRAHALQGIVNARSLSSASAAKVQIQLESILQPSHDKRAAPVLPAIWGLVIVLLLVAIVNLAGFLLTVATGRQREIALRLALGASRATVVRQLLTEGFVVGAAAAALGWLAIRMVIPLLDWMIAVPLGVPLRADLRTYLFLLAASVSASIAGGLAPVRYAARVSIVSGLNGNQARSRVFAGPTTGRALMVGLQVSISVVVLVLAVLWTRGAQHARDADLGFDSAHLLFLRGRHIGADWSAGDADRYWRSAIERVRALDAVVSVGLTRHLFGGGHEVQRLRHRSGEVEILAANRTDAEYFDAMQIRLLAGRIYSESEVSSDAPVAVVSDSVARRIWGTAPNALGASMARINVNLAGVTIIGVVQDAVQRSLMDLSDPIGAVYRPLPPAQSNDAILVIRVARDEAALRSRIEQVLPVFNGARPPRLARLEAVVQQQLRLTQIPSRIATLGAVCVVILTIVGLQGLVALAVQQRLKEIAIRVALGADGLAITGFVATTALRPVLWGLVAGIVGCVAIVRVMRAMLFGLSEFEPASLVVSCLLLVAAAVTGIAGPLTRALGVDPAETLKAT